MFSKIYLPPKTIPASSREGSFPVLFLLKQLPHYLLAIHQKRPGYFEMFGLLILDLLNLLCREIVNRGAGISHQYGAMDCDDEVGAHGGLEDF